MVRCLLVRQAEEEVVQWEVRRVRDRKEGEGEAALSVGLLLELRPWEEEEGVQVRQAAVEVRPLAVAEVGRS